MIAALCLQPSLQFLYCAVNLSDRIKNNSLHILFKILIEICQIIYLTYVLAKMFFKIMRKYFFVCFSFLMIRLLDILLFFYVNWTRYAPNLCDCSFLKKISTMVGEIYRWIFHGCVWYKHFEKAKETYGFSTVCY